MRERPITKRKEKVFKMRHEINEGKTYNKEKREGFHNET